MATFVVILRNDDELRELLAGASQARELEERAMVAEGQELAGGRNVPKDDAQLT